MKTNGNPHLTIGLLKLVSSFIYEKAEKDLAEELGVIAESHRVATGQTNFLYKGAAYAPANHVNRVRANLLSRHLYDRMDSLKKARQELQDEQSETANFLAVAMTAANTPRDFKALLPECVHPVFRAAGIEENQLGTLTISPETVEDFLQKHARFIQTIKRRLMLNIVT